MTLTSILILFAYGLVGLSVRIAVNYYSYSKKIEATKHKVIMKKFIRAYDQDWILGAVVALALAAGGNYLWEHWVGPIGVKALGMESIPPFAPQLGIIFGLFSPWLGKKIARFFESK